MRFDIVANKGKDVVYKTTYSEVEAIIIEWELRMSGYKTRVVKEK